MLARVRLERAPSAPRQRYEVSKVLALALGLPLSDGRGLLSRAPITLPRGFEDAAAAALVERLVALGGSAQVVRPSEPLETACTEHALLDGVENCRECGVPLCVACAARQTPDGRSLCARCAGRLQTTQRRFQARMAVWLSLLALVSLYAVQRWWSRRVDWSEPTRVAFVLVTPEGEEVDASAIEGFKQRVPALEERLRDEASKYMPASVHPFDITMLGPVEHDVAVPRLESDAPWDLVRFNYDLWRFSRHIDERGGFDTRGYDVRIYVSASPPRSASRQSVEGASQEGGSLGLVEVELAPDSVDFGLFVAAHELLHTRGASDKYGSDGLALKPVGYADPDSVPLYPQVGAEVMARGRPLSPTLEAAPDHLEVLTVGAETAREIGWSQGR